MNIRNIILFVCTIIIYVMCAGGLVKLGLDIGHSPNSFTMFFAYCGIALCTAIIWPMFEDMYKSIFKEE